MKNKLLVVLLIALMPFMAAAQDTKTNTTKTKHKKTAKTGKMPAWASAQNYDATSHVYFPDYYSFYDPNRGGYVFWEKGKWSFSPSVPPFLANVDLSKSRVQILKGLSLDLHPEENYPYYMEMYPPDENNNTKVPVPSSSNPANY